MTTVYETPTVLHTQCPGSDGDDGLTNLSNDELLPLHLLTIKLLCDRRVQCTLPAPPQHHPDELQITCIGLKPCYKGSATELIPTLNLIHGRRQNETWYLATILPLEDGSEIDIVQQFSKVSIVDVEKRAKI
jgi:hypothetical protein